MMELQNIFDFIPDTHYNYTKVFPQGYRIRLFECFAGVGMTRMAFNRLQIPYESVGISEIDKYALKSYEAIHGDCNNYGDITKIESLPPCDILTWSFPCTDLSKAGKQAGMVEGTRSNLGWEIIRLVKESNHKPTVLIMENVVDLVQEKFAKDFWEMRVALERIGYKNRYQVLNAKDYGVAQNRERVFMVSILGDWYYEFPVRMKLEKRLKDYLEDKVDEKYYIKDFDSITKISETYSQLNGGKWENMHDIGRRFYDTQSISPTIHTMGGGNLEPKIAEPICLNSQVNGKQPSLQERVYSTDGTSTAITTAFMPSIAEDVGVVVSVDRLIIPSLSGDIEAFEGDGVIASRPHQTYMPVVKQASHCIRAGNAGDSGVVQNLRIRKLTPIECWRLMGIDDEDFHKAQAVVSNSQLYKQAGNGLVVDVFAGILKGLVEWKNYSQ